MSPEQASTDPLDGRSDLYALGLVFFRMLTGGLPFGGKSTQEALLQRITGEPNKLTDVWPEGDLTSEVQAVLDRALARRREDRYPTAADFSRAVLGVSGGVDEEPATLLMDSSQMPPRAGGVDLETLPLGGTGPPDAPTSDPESAATVPLSDSAPYAPPIGRSDPTPAPRKEPPSKPAAPVEEKGPGQHRIGGSAVTTQARRKRRLAAVWFVDIVGYTALTAKDEDAALTVVDELQRLANEAVDAEDGRVVKYLGDAVLTVFDSADSALRSALALQQAFHSSETLESLGVSIRIGVHVGEVVEAVDGDIYGDGVNTASRVEQVAQAGQVAVTDAVYQQFRNRPEYVAKSLGTHTLKGLPTSVQIWAIHREGEEVSPPAHLLPPPKTGLRRVDRRAVSVGVIASLVAFVGLSLFVAGRTEDADDDPDGSIQNPVERAADGTTGEEETAVGRIADGPGAAEPDDSTQPAGGAGGAGAGGIDPPARPAIAGWTVSDERDPFSDAWVISVSISDASGATLELRCQGTPSQLAVAVIWPTGLRSDNLLVRVGSGRAQPQRWELDNDGRTVTFRGDPRRLIRSLVADRALVVGGEASNGRDLTAQFDLSGLMEAAASLRETCPW